MNDKVAIRARLVQLGPEQVRLMLAQQALPPSWNLEIFAWLAEIENEHRMAQDSADHLRWQQQLEMSTSANRAAWIAAWAGIAATIISLIALGATMRFGLRS